MIVKFNPSGTHIHKGYLKIRLDVYPAPTDKTYAQQYVGGILNPCLCHFLVIDTDIDAQKLTDKIRELFSKDTITAIDSALSDGDMMALQTLMKSRLGSGKVVYGDPSNVINTILSAVRVEV